jgi:hypothetical protein
MPFRSCAGEPNKPAILRARRNKLWKRKVQRSSFSLLPPRSSTSPHTIRGWLTEIPSWRGRGGIRIPASGMTGLTFPGESVSRSVGSGVSDGAGVIGDSIGITDTQLMITTGTTPAAPPFTTVTIPDPCHTTVRTGPYTDRNGQTLWQSRVGEGGTVGGIEWGLPQTAEMSTWLSYSLPGGAEAGQHCADMRI